MKKEKYLFEPIIIQRTVFSAAELDKERENYE
jgi:hypothetical protein